MTERITAEEAHSIATEGYEKQMDKKIKDHLVKIYDSIRKASQNGRMTTIVEIAICGDKYRDKISDLLTQDGFKCSYNYDDFIGDDIITISWNPLE